MLLFSCMHLEKSFSLLLMCVPCQEITQDCTQSLLRNHLNNIVFVIQRKQYSLSARILHRAPPPRLQVDQNFLTQKIVADPKMRCHQKSFGIWRVTEAILGKKTWFFSKNKFWKKFIINHTIFLIFRYAFFRY